MKTKKKKQRVPNGLTFYLSGKEIRCRIYRNGRKIHGSTEGYGRLKELKENLESIHQYTDFSHITAAMGEYKNRKK